MSPTKILEDISTPTRTGPAPVPAGMAACPEPVESRTMHDVDVPALASPVLGRLGQYQLIREIGRGGMGAVYLARDLRLGRQVAIKLLDRRGSHDNARFLAESRLTARCNHENIVVIYDVGEHDHHPYMVLEYVAGRTLSAWLEERSGDFAPPLEPSLAAALMIPVVRALAYAHDMGIVHRDLKPANIMLTDAGTTKVLDFGIATLLADAELSGDYGHIPSIIEPGTIMGTLPYMAPEQLEGAHVDHRADLWAVGIMLYQMVTGTHPVIHDSVDLKRALLDIASLDLPMPRVGDRRADLGPLEGVIDRCLIKDKAHRTRDAHVLLQELEAVSARCASVASTSDRVLAPAERTAPQPEGFEPPDGIVGSCSPFYVARAELEQPCVMELVKAGALLRIKGPRQMGKTTLMMRLIEHATLSGARAVRVDLQVADARILGDLDPLLRWLCAVVLRRLKLAPIDEEWDDVFGPKDNCLNLFEDHVLGAVPGPLVLAFSSIDRLFAWPRVADEFLTFLRALHEMGKSQDPWTKLRLVLEYSTEMYLPMDLNHSPFNVGLAVALTEWDAEIVTALARRHGLAWGATEVTALMELIGGHPYLVRVALYHVARGMPLARLLTCATTDEGVFADHLKHLLWRLDQQPELAEATARVLAAAGPTRLDTELAFKLVSLGLVRQRGDDVEAGHELYRRYLSRHLAVE
jgi:serine/threonine-protein kinase